MRIRLKRKLSRSLALSARRTAENTSTPTPNALNPKSKTVVRAMLILLGWFSLVTCLVGQGPGSVSMEKDTNRQGMDYKNIQTAGQPEECRQLCAQDQDCEAYTWVPLPDNQGVCWLKNGVPQPIVHGTWVSGVKRSLPQGLSGGLTYYHDDTVDGGSVNDVETVLHSGTQTRGWRISTWRTVSDGDIGMPENRGFYHQELIRPPHWDPGSWELGGSRSKTPDAYILPAGTACGFHHTQNSPTNLTTGQGSCMGMDPGRSSCPAGWIARRHFDMGSGNGNVDCRKPEALLRPDACGYFVWCEYTDPHRLCEDPACVQTAIHMATVGILSNTDATGDTLRRRCPQGTIRTAFYDDGRPEGRGLSFCRN